MLARRCRPRCPPTPPRRTRARVAGGRSDRSPGLRHRARRPDWSSTPCSASAPRARPAATWRRRSGSSPASPARGVPVLAVDLPSGLDADRGQPLGDACVVAQHTLALIGAQARACSPASGATSPARSGPMPSASISTGTAPDAWLVGAGEIARGERPRRHAEHKGSFGDVAIVGGAAGMAGAALLAARAAHAAGAGRVFVELLDAGASALALDPERPELMLRPGWWQRRRRGGRADARWSAAAAAAMRCAPPLPRLRRPRIAAGARCRRAQRRRRRHRPANGAGSTRQPRPRARC